MKTVLKLMLVLASFAPGWAGSGAPERAPWTVLIYAGVDSSAEGHVMPHLRSLGPPSRQGQRAEVLLLIDRAPGHSDDDVTLGEEFEDTRLFRLREGEWQRVSGGAAFPEIQAHSRFEANTGDPHTLRKFIDFGKGAAPAERYALLLFGHGESRSVCPDTTNARTGDGETEDPLYVAEISEALGEAQSVDLIWFDVCSFGAIENAYELRPGPGRFSARAMLATPPLSTPAPLRAILQEAALLGPAVPGKDAPADGLAFGRLAIRVIEDSVADWGPQGDWVSWGSYDLAAVGDVKRAVDRLAVALARGDLKDAAERVRGSGERPRTMNYMHREKTMPRAWVVSPHFDLHDLARRFRDSDEMPAIVRTAAGAVMDAVERFVSASFGGLRYRGFEDGRNGVYIVFPDGDAAWGDRSHWAEFHWYHPDDRRTEHLAFGNYAWCADGAQAGNGVVENWFELMDSWFDVEDGQGGVNRYRW